MGIVKTGIPLADMIASLPAGRQRGVRAKARELIDRELTLRELRAAMGQTQAALAARLGVKQENVSRLEQRADVMLSTLNGYLAAMGGRLKLVAEFEGRAPVVLRGFGLTVDKDEAGVESRRVDGARLAR